MKTMQIVRLIGMVAAVAGLIYALEFIETGGTLLWVSMGLLAVGFIGLLASFRFTQRAVRRKERHDPRTLRRRV